MISFIAPGFIDPIEAVKEAVQFIRRDLTALIDHAEHN